MLQNPHHRWIVVPIAAATLALGGCRSLDDSLYQGYSAAPLQQGSLAPFSTLKAALIEAPKDGGPPIVDSACFGPATPANCLDQRNQAIAALLIGSDELCEQHRRSIYGRDTGWNLASGTAANLFAGMAAVVTGERRKTILSALALFSNSERSLVNETVYKQMIVTSVDKKIVEVRAVKAQDMRDRLGQSLTQYPIGLALKDVSDYHHSCSFMSGLRLALDEGTQGSNALRIQRLRQNLASVKVQLDQGAKGTEKTLLEQRQQAISDALKSLESQ